MLRSNGKLSGAKIYIRANLFSGIDPCLLLFEALHNFLKCSYHEYDSFLCINSMIAVICCFSHTVSDNFAYSNQLYFRLFVLFDIFNLWRGCLRNHNNLVPFSENLTREFWGYSIYYLDKNGSFMQSNIYCAV